MKIHRTASRTSPLAALACILLLFAASSATAQLGTKAESSARSDSSVRSAVSGVVGFVVTNTDDSGVGSLRFAIQSANVTGGADFVVFDPVLFSTPQTIVLTSGEIGITDSVTITGPGANLLTVSGNNSSRIFFIDSTSVSMSGLTLTAGNGVGLFTSGDGGAIQVADGSLSINGLHVTGNTSGGNAAGIYYQLFGTHQIVNSTFSNNTAAGACAGFNNEFGTMTVTNTTISGNTSSGNIAGGFCNNGTLTLRAVTITNNVAAFEGGGFYTGSTTDMGNTIVAGNSSVNTGMEDIFYGGGSLVSSGYNLIGVNTSAETAFPAGNPNVNFDIVGTGVSPVNARLGLLLNNGGPTPTHGFVSIASPAIDRGFSFGLVTDQRGQLRPVDRVEAVNTLDGADIGAYELQGTTAAEVEVSGRVRTAGGRGIGKVYVTITGPGLNQPLRTMTNALGYFNFTGIPTGQTYIVSVESRRSRVLESVRVISVTDDMTGVDFIAEL